MTILSIIQNVTDSLGLTRPSAVLTSSDDQVRQLLALANQEGKYLAREYPWQKLNKVATFTTVAAELQNDSSLTSITDINWHLTETFWDTSQTVRVYGPLTPRDYAYKDAIATAGPYSEFRYRQGNFYLLPAPAAGQTISFEYISTKWCESSGGTGQTAWAADTDVGVLDEYLMELGIIYRWLRRQGLSYAEEMREYMTQVELAKARDGGGKEILNITHENEGILMTRVPEGGWNL